MNTLKDSILEIKLKAQESDSEFPIYFDDAWKCLGYSKKYNAKRLLVKYFTEDVDYYIETVHHDVFIDDELDYIRPFSFKRKRSNGRFANREFIYLTLNCFKTFILMSGTSNAKFKKIEFLSLDELNLE